MPKASYAQSSFLGGEWSQEMQGQFERKDYRTALNVCRNSLPIAQGSWNRRPGEKFLATTRAGGKGRVIRFPIAQATPYVAEFTDGFLRFYSGIRGRFALAQANSCPVSGFSTAAPTLMTLTHMVDWATGDTIGFEYDGTDSAQTCYQLHNRQFVVTKQDASNFFLNDAVTGAAVDGSQLINRSPAGMTAYKVLEFPTPYVGGQWATLRLVQQTINGIASGVLLHGSYMPRVLTVLTPPNIASGLDATFSLTSAVFKDGPYLDPVPNSVLQIGATTTGAITCAVRFQQWSATTPYNIGDSVWSSTSHNQFVSTINGNLNINPDSGDPSWSQLLPGAAVSRNGQGFQASDIGRHIRILAEPAAWDSGTAYGVPSTVKFNGLYYVSLVNNTGVQPDTNTTDWAISPTAAVWVWGIITAITDPATVSVSLTDSDATIPSAYANFVFNTWQLGFYSDTTGWPTCGCFHEGRLYLAGVAANRWDASVPNDPFNFSPSQADGSVTDANAISYTLNDSEQNPIYWMVSDHQGVILGTEAAEWLIQASATNDAITASTVQTKKVTKFGSANIEPRHSDLTLAIVKRHQRKILEYFAEVFSGRFVAPNLSEAAEHLSKPSIQEIAFQKERTPIIWQRLGDGSLAGATYQRVSLFSSEPPKYIGWHRHDLGSGRAVESIASGPSVDGSLDSLFLVTNGSSGVRHVSMLTDIFDPLDPITEAWFLDDAVKPGGLGTRGGTIQKVAGVDTVTLFGMAHLAGQTVSVFLGGIDCGDHVVAADGSVAVALSNNPNDLLTRATLGALSNSGTVWGTEFSTILDDLDDPSGNTRYSLPAVVGFTYTSQGQMLRPILPNETGTPLGLSLGKLRNTYQFAALLKATAGISFGIDFDGSLEKAIFPPANSGPRFKDNQLFSGVYWGDINDSSTFDSMLSWQCTRPYSAIVCAIEAFLEGEER